MAFDREGALQAGYTPEEIDAFISQDQGKYTPADIASLNPGGADYVPKWGQDNPNTYAGVMSLLDAIPTVASFAGKAKVGIPLAAALSAGAGAVKRSIDGKETEIGDVTMDALKGAGLEGAGRGAGKLLSKGVADPISRWLAGKSLKFSSYPNVLTPVEKKEITETFFDNGLSATEKGFLKLQDLISSYSGKAKDAIQAATDAGTTFNPLQPLMTGGIPELMMAGKTLERTSPGYTKAVGEVADAFYQGGKRFTPNELDASKMNLQKQLADAFGQNTTALPSIQAKKQVSAGARETLESIPAVAENNAAASKLFDLSPHLARSVGRLANNDIIGLKNAVLLPQAFSSSNPTAWATFLNVVMNPQAQILAAKGIRQTGNIASKVPARSAIRRGLEGAMYSATGGPDGN